jgi:DNA-binding PadR family transcriptional regulator
MLELAVLGLLKERAMHGYQLKKRLSETLGTLWQVSYGSLYPALKRLQADGAVEMIFPKEQIGRRKNVYRITERGELQFNELVERAGHEASEDNGFSVRLAFFRYLKPETRINLLERRRAYLEGRWSNLREWLRGSKEALDGYTRSLMDHQLSATEHDIEWLDELIKAERRQSPSPSRGTRTRRARLAQQKEHA